MLGCFRVLSSRSDGQTNESIGNVNRNKADKFLVAPNTHHPGTAFLQTCPKHQGSGLAVLKLYEFADHFDSSTANVALVRLRRSFGPDGLATVGLKADAATFTWLDSTRVLYIATSARNLLKTHSEQDYKTWIASITTNSTEVARCLEDAAHRACSALKTCKAQNKAQNSTQVVPVPGLAFAMNLAITPVLVVSAARQTQDPDAALLIEHLPMGHHHILNQLVEYQNLLLEQTPHILTLCDLRGRVMHQNPASIRYAGNRMPLITASTAANSKQAQHDSNYLQDLLQYDPDLLDDLMEEVIMGSEWSAVVQVPSSLTDVGTLPSGNTTDGTAQHVAMLPALPETPAGQSPTSSQAQARADLPASSAVFKDVLDSPYGAFNNNQEFMIGTSPVGGEPILLRPHPPEPGAGNSSGAAIRRSSTATLSAGVINVSGMGSNKIYPFPAGNDANSLADPYKARVTFGGGLTANQNTANDECGNYEADGYRAQHSQAIGEGLEEQASTSTVSTCAQQSEPVSEQRTHHEQHHCTFTVDNHSLVHQATISSASGSAASNWFLNDANAASRGNTLSSHDSYHVYSQSTPGAAAHPVAPVASTPPLHRVHRAASSTMILEHAHPTRSPFDVQRSHSARGGSLELGGHLASLGHDGHFIHGGSPLKNDLAVPNSPSQTQLGGSLARRSRAGAVLRQPSRLQALLGSSPHLSQLHGPASGPSLSAASASARSSARYQLAMFGGAPSVTNRTVPDDMHSAQSTMQRVSPPIAAFFTKSGSAARGGLLEDVMQVQGSYMHACGGDHSGAPSDVTSMSFVSNTALPPPPRPSSGSTSHIPPPNRPAHAWRASWGGTEHHSRDGTSSSFFQGGPVAAPRASRDLHVLQEHSEQYLHDSQGQHQGPSMAPPRDPCIAAPATTQQYHPAHHPGNTAAAAGAGGVYDGDSCWHEIRVCPVKDPYTQQTVLLVLQEDVTGRLEAEQRMAQVSDACINLLELIFPRHVIEHLAVKQQARLQGAVDGAAARYSSDTGAAAPHGGDNDDPRCQQLSHAAQGTAAVAAAGVSAPVGIGVEGGVADADHHMLDQLAHKHPSVTLFFCDVVGFTTMSKEVEPAQVMRFLNELYTQYDALVDKYGVYKVETVGDCYVVAGGLMSQDDQGFAVVNTQGDASHSHAVAVYRFAQEVLQVARRTRMPHNGSPVQVRIGLHSGPVTSGVVGYRMPKFCLFGDTMNTASRMETTGMPGCIHMSNETYALLEAVGENWDLACTGGVEVKGKGKMMTYIYKPPPESLEIPQQEITYIGQPNIAMPSHASKLAPLSSLDEDLRAAGLPTLAGGSRNNSSAQVCLPALSPSAASFIGAASRLSSANLQLACNSISVRKPGLSSLSMQRQRSMSDKQLVIPDMTDDIIPGHAVVTASPTAAGSSSNTDSAAVTTPRALRAASRSRGGASIDLSNVMALSRTASVAMAAGRLSPSHRGAGSGGVCATSSMGAVDILLALQGADPQHDSLLSCCVAAGPDMAGVTGLRSDKGSIIRLASKPPQRLKSLLPQDDDDEDGGGVRPGAVTPGYMASTSNRRRSASYALYPAISHTSGGSTPARSTAVVTRPPSRQFQLSQAAMMQHNLAHVASRSARAAAPHEPLPGSDTSVPRSSPAATHQRLAETPSQHHPVVVSHAVNSKPDAMYVAGGSSSPSSAQRNADHLLLSSSQLPDCHNQAGAAGGATPKHQCALPGQANSSTSQLTALPLPDASGHAAMTMMGSGQVSSPSQGVMWPKVCAGVADDGVSGHHPGSGRHGVVSFTRNTSQYVYHHDDESQLHDSHPHHHHHHQQAARSQEYGPARYSQTAGDDHHHDGSSRNEMSPSYRSDMASPGKSRQGHGHGHGGIRRGHSGSFSTSNSPGVSLTSPLQGLSGIVGAAHNMIGGDKGHAGGGGGAGNPADFMSIINLVQRSAPSMSVRPKSFRMAKGQQTSMLAALRSEFGNGSGGADLVGVADGDVQAAAVSAGSITGGVPTSPGALKGGVAFTGLFSRSKKHSSVTGLLPGVE